jgi:hypothetical protein
MQLVGRIRFRDFVLSHFRVSPASLIAKAQKSENTKKTLKLSGGGDSGAFRGIKPSNRTPMRDAGSASMREESRGAGVVPCVSPTSVGS